MLTPQVLAIIRVTFPAGRPRARAFAVMGAVLGMASVLGQILGGLVVEANLWGLAWRPVFLINLPIGLGAVIAAPFVVPESYGWPPWSLAMLGVSVVVLAAFVADQARKSARNRAPLLDLSLFTGRSFSLGAAAVLAFSATMPPLYLAFTVLVQTGYGASPLTPRSTSPRSPWHSRRLIRRWPPHPARWQPGRGHHRRRAERRRRLRGRHHLPGRAR